MSENKDQTKNLFLKYKFICFFLILISVISTLSYTFRIAPISWNLYGEIYQKNGPEFFREDDSKSFILKNIKNTELMWIGNNRKIISLEKRKHTEAVKFMKEFLRKNLQTGIPKGLQNDFKRGFKVSMGNKNLSKSIKEAASDLILTDGAILHFN